MSETPKMRKKGTLQDFLNQRATCMSSLITTAGGDHTTGGPIVGVNRLELPHPGQQKGKTIYNWPVDAHDRAYGCLVEEMSEDQLELKIAQYDEPRIGYRTDPDPLKQSLGHSQLN